MIPWLKRMWIKGDTLGCSHTGVKKLSRQVEEDAKALGEILRQGRAASFVENKEEIERRFQKLFEGVFMIAVAFEIHIKTK